MTLTALETINTLNVEIPQPNKVEILSTLKALHQPNDVIELRIIPKSRKCTHVGYFDQHNWELLADYAVKYSELGEAVYITLNPIDPQLISRCANRIETNAKESTTDKHVTKRRWLLIDLDPVRPSGISATDVQVEAAMTKAIEIHKHLDGWAGLPPYLLCLAMGFTCFMQSTSRMTTTLSPCLRTFWNHWAGLLMMTSSR